MKCDSSRVYVSFEKFKAIQHFSTYFIQKISDNNTSKKNKKVKEKEEEH